MTNVKTKSCLIADNGLFVELAPRLARDFGEVKLFVPWASGYPKAAPAYVGTGLKDVQRVEEFWPHVPNADVVVFPDLYFCDWQEVVIDRFHKPVWGHRAAETIELDRWGTRKLQRKIGIDGPRTKHFLGVDSLEEYLSDPANEDKWVKISCYRGDGETWHHDNWHTSEVYLNYFRNRVGALANSYEFIVEDAINDAIEVGYDGFTVRGKFPDAAYWGFEVKDQAYVGKFSPYSELPSQIRDINAKVAPILEEERATGFCSFESRITKDGGNYMIDPCMRCGSPPIEVTMEEYENLAEIIWEGANGNLCPVKSTGEFAVLALMHSKFALSNWVAIDVPQDVRRWVKLRNRAEIDGKIYHVPVLGEMPEIGAVVAVADTLEEAKRLVKERAEQVKGYEIEVCVEALDSAEDEIKKAKKYGVDF